MILAMVIPPLAPGDAPMPARPIRSYYGLLVAAPDRRFATGRRLHESARFSARADAAAWLDAMTAGPVGRKAVIRSTRPAEIVRHCPGAETGSVGGKCPGCGVILTPAVVAAVAADDSI
jgi:hypothetical protein